VASITIRNLDDSLKKRLRIRAAERGDSMEEETQEILCRIIPAQFTAGEEWHYRLMPTSELDAKAISDYR